MKANPKKRLKTTAHNGSARIARASVGARTIRWLSAALMIGLVAPAPAFGKQLCSNPDGESTCCRAWGGTWVTGGSGGFCYRNLRISSAGDEAACKASGGKVETKDGQKVCLTPITAPAPFSAAAE
jgi:hypothetical protein